MTKNAVEKTWVIGTDLTLSGGVYYSDPANIPGGGDPGDNVPVASQYALEIVYPRAAGSAPDLDSTNRCFFAYPGLTYEIPLVAGWGSYPYTWEVSGGEAGKFAVVEYTMASGMTGHLLRYTNPQDGDDTSITITCTDAASDTDSVSYSITVGTSGWYFLDANSDGSGDSGTISAPFDTLAQAYSGMGANTRLYIRAGTYNLDGIETSNPSLPDGAQGAELHVLWEQASRGAVFIAYPGESPILDFGYDHSEPDPVTGYADPVPRIRVGGVGVYIEGLTLLDPMVMAFRVGRGSRYGSVVWRNTATGGGPATGLGDNAAYFMYTQTYGSGGVPDTQVYHDVMVSNHLADVVGDAQPVGFKCYSMLKPVIEGNYLHGFDELEALAPKADISQFFIVANRFADGAGVGGNHDSHNVDAGELTYGDHAYNWYEPDSSGLRIALSAINVIGATHIYRNSLSDIYINPLRTGDGPYVFEKNAVQNANGAQTPFPYIVDTAISDASRLTWGDNLEGSSGIFDEDGELVDPDGVGIYGHVIP